MANLSITALCNRDCRYCFARHAIDVAALPSPHIASADFDAALDRIVEAGMDQVRLLGGEPTLHPRFAELVDRVLARGLRLMIFSNGWMPRSAVRRLERTPPDRVAVLINLATPPPLDVLRRLGPRILLGVNIDTPAAPLDPLLDLIAELGLAKGVRLGLAHPRVGGDNAFLPPRLYAAVGERVAAFAAKARAAEVRVELDCGFVPCMFPPGALETLGLSASDVGTRCNALPDLLPDGTAVPCYPLADVWRVGSARPLAAVRREAEEFLAPWRTAGVFRECASCALRRSGVCRGGCLAAAMRRLRGSESRRPAGVERSTLATSRNGSRPRWVIPYVDQPLPFWQQVADEFGEQVREVYFPMPGGIVGSGRPPQPEEHLEAFLRWGGLGCAVLVNPVVLPEPLDRIAPRVIEALRRLVGEYGVGSVTVADLDLARRIRQHLPAMEITASTLMEIGDPDAAAELNGVCDHLVPASGIMRDIPKLRTLRARFRGTIRLLVNESCLSGCAFRYEHFRQMAGSHPKPASLCEPLLAREPWQRITGSFVLPQHLHFYDGVYDDLKLAGRVTLRDAADYLRVLGGYVHRFPLTPAVIGGGPASLLEPVEVSEAFYRRTLACGHRCSGCTFCRDYYAHATANAS